MCTLIIYVLNSSIQWLRIFTEIFIHYIKKYYCPDLVQALSYNPIEILELTQDLIKSI